MKLVSNAILIIMLILISGCSSKSIVLKDAPKEGIHAQGINILYRTFPLAAPTDVKKLSALTAPTHPQIERLGKDIEKRMPLDFKNKGLHSNFATLNVPGIAMTSKKDLCPPSFSKNYYTLIITPVREHVFCYQTCSTTYTVLLSLKTPNEDKEVWDLMLIQSKMSASDIMPFKNYQFINDMANAVLNVVHN
ncbi:hypothetical protein [Sulfurimonas sp. HSL-1716]|uniref:hypothetical protein n=1 Tax=Hydrocurvibacter sulfurireducens TaxID=3131937 RepID=UPI0031F89CDB